MVSHNMAYMNMLLIYLHISTINRRMYIIYIHIYIYVCTTLYHCPFRFTKNLYPGLFVLFLVFIFIDFFNYNYSIELP